MNKLPLILAGLGIALLTFGCNNGSSTSSTANPSKQSASGGDGHEGHDHGAHDQKAPHGGHLIELGRNHEYHAELLDDHKTETVTIYMMDGDMKPLAIPEPSVSLILSEGENNETFELLANQKGSAAEFSSQDEKLMAMIEKEKVQCKLRVTLDGKSFTGAFTHLAHGHEDSDGHDHD
jgi:hypothetical protein